MKDLSNKIEQISYKLESVKAIIELVATGSTDDSESASLWGCSELLSVYIEKLVTIAEDISPSHESN